MCGRFSLTATPRELADVFGLLETEDFPARYNIAPIQPILIVIAADRPVPGSNLPDRRAMLVRWGLTPSWVKDPRDFPLLINARSETAIGKASFKAAMRHRRVPPPASTNGIVRPKKAGRPRRPTGSGPATAASLPLPA